LGTRPEARKKERESRAVMNTQVAVSRHGGKRVDFEVKMRREN
jgi:hypothetical protein